MRVRGGIVMKEKHNSDNGQWERIKDVIFDRLDRKMKEDRLFLDCSLTLPRFSKLSGTNRTYASRAICGKYKNFKEYLNTLRVENILRDVQTEESPDLQMTDPDEIANRYGFRTKRSLDRILVRETGCTYRRILKRKENKD